MMKKKLFRGTSDGKMRAGKMLPEVVGMEVPNAAEQKMMMMKKKKAEMRK